MYDIYYSINDNSTIKYIPNDDCYIKCLEKAKQHTVFRKIKYLYTERNDFGYYGARIFLPHNLSRLNSVFLSRYMTSCLMECKNNVFKK
jgi:hypothetical protein